MSTVCPADSQSSVANEGYEHKEEKNQEVAGVKGYTSLRLGALIFPLSGDLVAEHEFFGSIVSRKDKPST